MISAVIVTYNEGEYLKDCLDSVSQNCDEIVIVDLGSSDATLKIAKTYSAKIFFHKKVDYVELVRDFAVSKATNDWVLVLDPDERVSKNLWIQLKNVISEKKCIAVNIPRKNIFFGRWIAHSNWWPDRHVRFFKSGKVKWNDTIHSYPIVNGKILNLPAREDLAIIHYGYKSISEFIERQGRYSTIAAQNLFERGERFSWFDFFWKPIREFLVRYIRHLGFLDGFYGFALVFLMMIYQLEVMIKLWELEKKR